MNTPLYAFTLQSTSVCRQFNILYSGQNLYRSSVHFDDLGSCQTVYFAPSRKEVEALAEIHRSATREHLYVMADGPRSPQPDRYNIARFHRAHETIPQPDHTTVYSTILPNEPADIQYSALTFISCEAAYTKLHSALWDLFIYFFCGTDSVRLY